jgi:hypothetical protein
MIAIDPPVKKNLMMNQITVSVLELKLFEYVKVVVQLYDCNGIPRDNRIYTIDPTNGYNDWNNDDAFIINWVKDRLREEAESS